MERKGYDWMDLAPYLTEGWDEGNDVTVALSEDFSEAIVTNKTTGQVRKVTINESNEKGVSFIFSDRPGQIAFIPANVMNANRASR